MQWAPLDASDFHSVAEQQTYMQLRRWVSITCGNLLTRASPQIESMLSQCQQRQCTLATCPLHTGCLLFTVQTLLQAGTDQDVTMQWCPALSLAAAHRHSLLRAALSYDRTSEVLVVVLIPADVLAPLVRPDRLQLPGVFGVGSVPLRDLAKGLVTACFQDVMTQLPPGTTRIEPTMLPVDPTDPSKLPTVTIVGLSDSDPQRLQHGSLPSMPWGDAHRPPTALVPVPALQVSDSKGGITPITAATAQAQVTRSSAESDAGTAAQPAITADISPSPTLLRFFLQATINKFWLTAGNLAQRLSNRVHKIRCRERFACDGSSCDWCRGAMVFTVSALEDLNKQPWRYLYRGQDLASNTPKQYIRGEWRTACQLASDLGCMDIQLVKAILTHDRRSSYVTVLHVPHHLVRDCLSYAPPTGLFLWRLCEHALPGLLPSGASPLPPIKSEYSYRSHDDCDHHNPQQPAQDVPVTALPAGPRVCQLAGCPVREEHYSGVQLLVCSGCRRVAYCTAEHQKSNWGSHKPVCTRGIEAASGGQ